MCAARAHISVHTSTQLPSSVLAAGCRLSGRSRSRSSPLLLLLLLLLLLGVALDAGGWLLAAATAVTRWPWRPRFFGVWGGV